MDDWTLSLICLIIAAGATIGFLAGMFGVGGGFLLVPVLNIFLGVPMPIAVGSVSCFVLGPATTALLTRRPSAGTLQLPLLLFGGLGCGVAAGSHALQQLTTGAPVQLAGRSLPLLETTVLTSYAIVMLLVAAFAVRDAALHDGQMIRSALLGRLALPPIAEIQSLSPSRYSIPVIGWTGVAVGFLSGFLGISGGLLLIPILTSLMGIRLRDSVTISTVIVWFVSFGSTMAHAPRGNVDLGLVALLLFGGTLGARVGAEAGMRISGRKLRWGFAALVALSCAVVCTRLWQLWVSAMVPLSE